MKTSLLPDFKGKRWLKIGLRTFHLVGFAGVFASALNQSDQPVFWALTIFTGVGLLILESLSNLIWFVQVRGLIIYIKLGLLYGLYVLPEFAVAWMIAIIVLSGIISHAPSSFRYFSLLHGKKVTSLQDTKG